jgi:hypothetical protein
LSLLLFGVLSLSPLLVVSHRPPSGLGSTVRSPPDPVYPNTTISINIYPAGWSLSRPAGRGSMIGRPAEVG